MTLPAKFFWSCIICLFAQLLTWRYLEKNTDLTEQQIKNNLLSTVFGIPGNLGIIISAIWWIFSL
jgi:hypothetical protein